jgi:hypothetical protein
MKARVLLPVLLLAFGLGIAQWMMPLAAEERRDEGKVIHTLDSSKIEEADAKTKLEEPHYGYVGELGTFDAIGKKSSTEEPIAQFVVHQHPDVHKLALGCTRLKYEGPKRLGNVDGWIFKTEWDGKYYPSKVFLSADKVYFGGGRSAYIAADYRNDTGWTWKQLPLRRMEMARKGS